MEALVECVLSLGRGKTGEECDDKPGCGSEGLVFVGKDSGKDKIAGVRISAGESLVREGVGKKNLVSSNTTWGVTYTRPVRGSRHKYPLFWKLYPRKTH